MDPDKAASVIPVTNAETVSNVEAMFLKESGNECFRQGNFEEAYKLYCKSLDIMPDLNTYNNRAICNMRMKNYISAMEDLDRVLQADCNNVKALFRRAMCRKEINNLEEELEDLFAILKLEPNSSIVKRELLIAKDNLFHKNGKNEIREKCDETAKNNYFRELYRNDIQACSSLMRNISFEHFQETIRDCGFSKEALTTIIESLCRKFDIESEWHLVYKYLIDMASLNCIDILCKSMKSDSKFMFKQMLRRATSLGLDNCYKLAEIYKPLME